MWQRRLIYFLYLILAIWLAAAIVAMKIPPQQFWVAGFIAYTLPFALLLNLCFLLFWIWKRSLLMLLPLVVLLLTWNYYERLTAFHKPLKADPHAVKLQVLNFNVRVFNTYSHLHDENHTSAREIIDWVSENPSDILCLQEYYNCDTSAIYNTTSRIGTRHSRYAKVSAVLVNRIGAEFGLAVFSRFPIVADGKISFGDSTQNHAMYADIAINADTIRVYNCHLQSIKLEEKDLAAIADEKNRNGLSRLINQLKTGFVSRGMQVDKILHHIKNSPYPVILCGDLNDLPFSYTYDQLNLHLNNAFTSRGSGIGATYNGSLPSLRIDNQFFSDHFKILTYKTHYNMVYSDHFPITATYQLIK